MKKTQIAIQAILIPTLIAGYTIPIQGLQNLASAFIWMVFTVSLIAVLYKADEIQEGPYKRHISKTILTIIILSSTFLFYHGAFLTGTACLFTALLVDIIKSIKETQEKECTS